MSLALSSVSLSEVIDYLAAVRGAFPPDSPAYSDLRRIVADLVRLRPEILEANRTRTDKLSAEHFAYVEDADA